MFLNELSLPCVGLLANLPLTRATQHKPHIKPLGEKMSEQLGNFQIQCAMVADDGQHPHLSRPPWHKGLSHLIWHLVGEPQLPPRKRHPGRQTLGGHAQRMPPGRHPRIGHLPPASDALGVGGTVQALGHRHPRGLGVCRAHWRTQHGGLLGTAGGEVEVARLQGAVEQLLEEALARARVGREGQSSQGDDLRLFGEWNSNCSVFCSLLKGQLT